MQAPVTAMEWTTTAASTLRPRRIAIAAITVFATASVGYLLYQNIYDPLSGPDPSRRLHRSNAIRRRRRSLRERAPSDATSTSAESDADENAHIGADGETVAEDQNTVEDDWWNDPASAPQQRAGQNIVSLLFRVSEDNARRNAYVHRGCACNACGIVPIRGIRYRCANCADFDLCETCESQGHHINTHIFYKVKIPAPPFGPRQSQPVWYTGEPENCIRKLPKALMAKLSKETGFERPELEAFWEQWTFMANTEWRDDPDELLLAMDRRTFERCLVPSGGYRHTAPNLIHDRMFAFYDTNNDDLIGFSEFLHGLSYRKRKDKLRRIFDGFDMDRDGYVSRKDFLRIFRAYYVLYKQMHKDILEGLDDQVLGSSEVHQLVTGRQPLSSFFGREGRVPPARGSRPLEGKLAQNGDMVVNGIDTHVVKDDKADITDRNAVLSSLFLPLRNYQGSDYGGEDEDTIGHSPPSEDYYSQIESGATSPRYLNGLLNPPTGIDELPSLLAGDPRPGDDLFVSEEEGERYDAGGSGPDGQTHGTSNGVDDSDFDGRPALELLQDGFRHSTSSRGQPHERTRRSLEDHRAKVAKAKYMRNIARERLLERWRRRQFFLDEEEGAVPPDGSASDPKDILGYKNPHWEDPRTAQRVPPPFRSRNSSRVRFAGGTDDFDGRSRARSVPERWGGIEIHDAERDAGKEILYQVTQQAYNELLDMLFNDKENDAMTAALTKACRDKYKDLVARTRWEDVTDTPDDPSRVPRKGDLEDIRNKSVDELLAMTGYAIDPALEKQGGEANDDAIAEFDRIYGEAEEDAAPAVELCQDTEGPHETNDQHRDPTMPQFRPNSASDLAKQTPDTNGAPSPNLPPMTSKAKGKAPATDDSTIPKKVGVEEKTPSKPPQDKLDPHEWIDRQKLWVWKLGQMAEDEAKARGGWGRLSFEEFEKIYKDEERRDNRLDYLGSWIDFCIP
ncbi:hypothetical protein GE09DRAFT_1089386 [Coniochaeta sp. 2T2.1]|nr:hypothetical protein GE09DRAFT_1089386 [Coniochaeta sp. 2T2.1]